MTGAEPVKYFACEVGEDNEAHLTRHGVTVTEVVRSDPETRRNRRARRAGYIATGTTDGGRRMKIAFDLARLDELRESVERASA